MIAPHAFAAGSEGAKVTFRTSVADAPRTATVELRTVNEVAFVAVNEVLHQFGGGTTVLPGRAEFDFLGRSAWIRFDSQSVNASLSQFQIRHPLQQDDSSVLMALSDVVPFFKEAFGIDVSQDLTAAERPPERIREPETVVMEDLTLPDTREEVPLADLSGPSAAEATVQGQRRDIQSIVIDAGHGGPDTGGQSAAILEKDLTLAVARRVQRLLQASFGGRVTLTRSQDVNPPLEARAGLANAQAADVVISIHAGASLSPSAHGFELFVPAARGSGSGGETPAAHQYAVQSADMAALLAQELARATEAPNRGVHTARCRLFDAVNAPCVVIEVGSLTNYAEAPRLAEEAYQMRLAQGIADGLLACAGGSSQNGAAP